MRQETPRTGHSCLFDMGRDTAVVVVAGCGRSGSTWISDILNSEGQYRYIFEPLHPSVEQFRSLAWQYVRPHDTHPDKARLLQLLLAGKFRSPWTDAHNTRRWAFRRLIKFIRANLMLKWLRANFPTVPIILLLRHPFAVAVSKMRQLCPDNWMLGSGTFLRQTALMEDHLAPFSGELEKGGGAFEQHVRTWCVLNYVPLRQFALDEVHVCFYETFCVEPEQAIRDMFSYLKEEMPRKALAKARKPSFTAGKDSACRKGANLIDGWRRELSADEIRSGVEILDVFGLTAVYTDDPMPCVGGLSRVMQATVAK